MLSDSTILMTIQGRLDQMEVISKFQTQLNILNKLYYTILYTSDTIPSIPNHPPTYSTTVLRPFKDGSFDIFKVFCKSTRMF